MNPTLAVLQAIVSTMRDSGPLVVAFPLWKSDGQNVFSFYPDLAPEGAPLPFLVYSVVSAVTNSVYGGVEFSEPVIRFTGYAEDSEVAMEAMGVFITLFDNLKLPLPSGNLLQTLRLTDPIPRLDTPSTDAQAPLGGSPSYCATTVSHGDPGS
jgi:hypothetical protein